MSTEVPVNRIVADIITISKESNLPKDFLLKSGQRMKQYLGVDDISYKEVSQDAKFIGAEEFALNSGKPYLDNRLSGYSAFPDLIEYFNVGFKSCLILPIRWDLRGLGVITMLSRQEDLFDGGAVDALSIVASVISTEAGMKLEREKSLSVARYFDAAFNTILPQVLVERDGTIVKANKSMMNVVEKPSKDFSARNIKDFFDMTQETVDGLAAGKPVITKSRLYQNRQFRVTSGKISERLMHLLFDELTEVIELEDKADFLDKSEEVFMLLDDTMRIIWASSNLEKALRVDQNAVLGKRIVDFASDSDDLKAQLTKVAEGAYTARVKLNMGNDVFADVRLSIFKNRAGFSCIISTDYEKMLSSAMKTSDEILQISGDVAIKVDTMGSIVAINKAAERILKYKNSEIAGMPISSICADKESQANIDSAISIVKKNGIVTDMFVNLLPKTGEEPVPFEEAVLLLKNPKGEPLGYVFTGTEQLTKKTIDEYRDQMERFAREARDFKQQSDLKTQFINNISHDLKTPITNIKGYSKLLMQEEFGTLTEEQKKSMEVIVSEGDRLLLLVQQILDVAKLEAGKMKLDRQQVNFHDLMENPSIKAFEEACSQKGLSFSIAVEYDVPEVTADPNRLIQVFVNLIGNAWKFTEHGGIKVHIFRKGKEKSVRVEVTDTGIGVPEEDKPKLFRKFYQLPRKGNIRPEGTGTGLGLSIVREIVKLHGGKVGVNSNYGKGSTFWFTIPIERKKRRSQDEEQDNS
jgi:PAS domain S-box-containing protein